jgi:hypothetical protein
MSEEHLKGLSMSVCLSVSHGFSRRRETCMARGHCCVTMGTEVPLLEHIVEKKWPQIIFAQQWSWITLMQQWPMWCGVKNTFGKSVSFKEYTFQMLLNVEAYYICEMEICLSVKFPTLTDVKSNAFIFELKIRWLYLLSCWKIYQQVCKQKSNKIIKL